MNKSGYLSEIFDKADEQNYFDPFKDISLISPNYELGRDSFRTNPKKKIAGYDSDNFKSIDDIYGLMHPDDREFVFDFSKQAILFFNEHVEDKFNAKTNVIFRAKGKNGKMYYIHRQAMANGLNGGNLTHNISYMNDVSWMHPKNIRSWNMECDNSHLFDLDFIEVNNFKKHFTAKEVQIIRLLARGFQSKDIARLLRISRHTVDTHRRNMLHKLDAANTPQLIDLAREMKLF